MLSTVPFHFAKKTRHPSHLCIKKKTYLKVNLHFPPTDFNYYPCFLLHYFFATLVTQLFVILSPSSTKPWNHHYLHPLITSMTCISLRGRGISRQGGLSIRKLRRILGLFSQSLRNNSSQSWWFN